MFLELEYNRLQKIRFILYTGNSTKTIARGPFCDGSYKLFGYKWFSSAADAQMAFTLARIVGKDGQTTKV